MLVTFIEDKFSDQKKVITDVDLYELPDKSLTSGSQMEAAESSQEIR